MCVEQCICNSEKIASISQDLLAMFLTIVSGVFVFVVGQLFNEYWLKPIQNYKKLRAQISYSLCFYANLYMNPITLREDENKIWYDGSQKMRELSAEVRATIELKPFGNIFIPPKKKLEIVAQDIMGISNGFFKIQEYDYITANERHRKEICKLLKIRGEK